MHEKEELDNALEVRIGTNKLEVLAFGKDTTAGDLEYFLQGNAPINSGSTDKIS